MIEPTRRFAVRDGRTAWDADLRIQGHRDEPLASPPAPSALVNA